MRARCYTHAREVSRVSTILALAVTVTACHQKPQKDFSLTIVVAERLGESKSGRLPSEVIELCLPIQECSRFDLIPRPSLQRLGSDPPANRSLETHIDAGFAGDRTNLALIRRRIEAHLCVEEIGSAFTTPNDPAVDLNVALTNQLASIEKLKHAVPIIFLSTGAAESKYHEASVYSDIGEIRGRIAKELCEGDVSSAIIFFNPPLSATPQVGVTVASVSSEIEARNVTIERTKEGPQRAALVKQIVVEYRPRVADDPIALYSLSKTIIYGREHHEAFEMLEQAARLAIRQGKAAILYDRMVADIENDLKKDRADRTIWRLTTSDHKHHWLPIVEALTHNDESLLHED
jgi:hypothetical protein